MPDTIFIQMTEAQQREWGSALEDALNRPYKHLPNRTILALAGLRTAVTHANRVSDETLADPDPRPVSRDRLLEQAARIISGERAETYGSAKESFERIGQLWSAVLGQPVSGTDVARLMILMKVSRLQHHEDHADSWLDIAGYAALGAEIAGAKL